jgi:hypothetical protein
MLVYPIKSLFTSNPFTFVTGNSIAYNSIPAANKFDIYGGSGFYKLGYSLQGNCDVNGDGIDDLLMSDESSKIVILFGDSTYWLGLSSTIVDIDTIPATRKLVITKGYSRGWWE